MPTFDRTTIAVRDAISGKAPSLEWVIQRFTPALLAQARMRLQAHLQDKYAPEDLVQDVWMTALPKLVALRPRNGRMTPVLLRFLSKILVNHYGTLLQKLVHGKPIVCATEQETLLATTTAAFDRACRNEEQQTILRCIDELDERTRKVIILRGVEQASNEEAAAILGLTPQHIAVIYHRSLKKLRARLPNSLFADLADAEEPSPDSGGSYYR